MKDEPNKTLGMFLFVTRALDMTEVIVSQSGIPKLAFEWLFGIGDSTLPCPSVQVYTVPPPDLPQAGADARV